MQTYKLRLSKILLFAILSALLCSIPSVLSATNAAIVKIYASTDDNGRLILDPAKLYVSKNTVVIWMNGMDKEEVQIIFQDGKACQELTLSPTEKGFGIDAKSCYVASLISYLSTSSLKFVENGIFEYIVATLDGNKAAKGKIFVTSSGAP